MNVSLDDLDATAACAGAVEFEYISPAGNPTGIFFAVIGSHSEPVTAATARLQNERRRKVAAREVQQKVGIGQQKVEFDKFEDDVAYGQQMAAARIVGWRGINDAFTPENALRLCKSNAHIAAFITQCSEELGNFFKL